MRICYDPIKDPITYFSDLANGAIFRYENEKYFIKVKTHRNINHINAVSLEDYSLLYFDDEDQVTPMDAILTIKGEEP